MSRLTWTPEMKQIAKDEKKALVKLQVQLKHVTGGNYSVVGPMSYDRALALFLTAALNDGDPRLAQVLDLLQAKKESPPSGKPWYTPLGKVGPACDDTEGYRCRSCDHTEYTRHNPPGKCPKCAFVGGA